MKPNLEELLKATAVIDWYHPLILERAGELSEGSSDHNEIVRNCFEWVRDRIEHGFDFQRNPVTCTASDVLLEGTGYCFAKSHLLAALLRANGIPTGFCYQRLSVGNAGAPYCLHGLNAVYLPATGWYRIDARGNKPGVNAQFTPPVERLAFRAVDANERLYPEILSDPLPIVLDALRSHSTWDELARQLPDWERAALLA
jgi:transglutaminase-like putative cysteine protease